MNIITCCEVTYEFVILFHYLKNFELTCAILFNVRSQCFVKKLIYDNFFRNIYYNIADTALTTAITLNNWPNACTECTYCMKIFQRGFFDFALHILRYRT